MTTGWDLFNALLTGMAGTMAGLMYAYGGTMKLHKRMCYCGFIGYVPFGVLAMVYGFLPDGTLARLVQ